MFSLKCYEFFYVLKYENCLIRRIINILKGLKLRTIFFKYRRLKILFRVTEVLGVEKLALSLKIFFKFLTEPILEIFYILS